MCVLVLLFLNFVYNPSDRACYFAMLPYFSSGPLSYLA